MAQKQHRIGKILLNADQPTPLSISQLHTWAIWQFPKDSNSKEMPCGAVCPPTESLEWFPAQIDFEQNHALIFAHLQEQFSSPEEACSYFTSSSG